VKAKLPFGSGRGIGVTCAIAGAAFFAMKAIFVKLAYRYGVDAETLLALRMGYAMPFFVAMGIAVARREPMALRARDWGLVALMGVLGYYVASYLDFLGLRYIHAALERLILFLYPTLVVGLSAVASKTRITGRTLVPIGLTYAGIALAVGQDLAAGDRDVLKGSALVFGSTLSYAVYLFLSGEAVKRLGSTRVVALSTTVACACALAQFLVLRPISALAQPWQVHALALSMALLSTVLPIWLITESMRRIGAGPTSMIGTLGPVLTIFFAWVLLGERLGGMQVLGAILVIAGVSLVARAPE
jgi:drug/metabolite transporter (DMT)-like permease